jgi:hypothetical protein
MADATGAAFLFENAALSPVGGDRSAMIEILFIYQLARNPLRAMARRWWRRGLFRVTSDKRHCPECGESEGL